MTEQETKNVLAYLNATWDMAKDKDPRQVLAVWHDIFRRDDARMVQAAAKLYVSQEKYAPKPADIREKIRELTAEREQTEMEAWNLVRKAIHGASMENWSRELTADGPGCPSAVVHFRELPEHLQLIVGSPEQLADWEKLDSKQLDTVVQSNFMRSYRSVSAERERLAMLPEDMRLAIAGVGTAPALTE